MKRYIKSNLVPVLFFAIAVFSACEDGMEELFLNVIATPSTVSVGDTVLFEIAGNAETYAIYTGDRGHEYKNSYLAIAAGEELDQSSLVLTPAGLDSAASWLEGVVNDYNNSVKQYNEDLSNDTTISESEKEYQDTVVFENMMADLSEFIVGNEYANLDEAAYYVSRDAMPMLSVSIGRQLVAEYFEDHGTYLVSDRGYDTGEPIDRYNLEYSYVYERAGIYTVTVIATDVSWKDYSGSGYKYDRTATSDEYTYNRLIKEITVVVQE